ncbi:aldehyde dehydrogenase family protein [Nocardia sp. NBC_01503]|uniref:aldehyde dehydrogenase family protein n=1 Tax=Nocardia sp. NBC_01503 TaxID=2975997 RepID=UPI002E7C1BEE|nr:aldehyde dehydrogenase family protein [Nocardia sp. NBC_01503]WTL30037.1 aldehyde dehydrogenase family protein [Nocardia sp. NBC_01503]
MRTALIAYSEVPSAGKVGPPMLIVIAPADGRVVDTIPAHTPEAVRDTVDRLRDNSVLWRSLGVVGRIHWLYTFRNWLQDNRSGLAALLGLETGKPEAEADAELALTLEALDHYRTHAAEFLGGRMPQAAMRPGAAMQLAVAHHSCAVVGVIGPWTYPLALAMFDALPALLAGAAVVVKPSSQTPLTMRAITAGWASTGAPGVFETVTGHDAGPAVVDHVDYVRFTGSAETGKVVALRAAARLIPCCLDLGGKSAAVVLADADLDKAAASIALGGLANSGQNPNAIERVYVESAVYDAFLDKLVDEAAAFGPILGDDTAVGVMTSAKHIDVVRDQVRDALLKGAILRCGGTASGHSFEPTVLADVDPTMAVLTQQTLGPVLPVVRVASAGEAFELALRPPGPPCVSVWTGDIAVGARAVGRFAPAPVGVNDVSVHVARPAPY